jgi:hypothetical protein
MRLTRTGRLIYFLASALSVWSEGPRLLFGWISVGWSLTCVGSSPLRLSLRLRVFLGWKEDVANQPVNVYMFSLVVMAASRIRRLAARVFVLG